MLVCRLSQSPVFNGRLCNRPNNREDSIQLRATNSFRWCALWCSGTPQPTSVIPNPLCNPSGAADSNSSRLRMFTLEESNKNFSALLGRRSFVAGSVILGVILAWRFMERNQPMHAETEAVGLPSDVTIIGFTNAGERIGARTLKRIVKAESEWKKLLSPDAFEVTRHAATEYPYTNENPNAHERGIFRCVCCDCALFNTDTKFQSGTGWPSFWAPIAQENVRETIDSSLGMVRTEVSCRLCDAHLGHVFSDGPRPTGLRYCINSVAIRFAKAT